MARTVRDAAILLTAISGMDHEEEESTLTIPSENMEINYLDYTMESVEGMRIGYVTDGELNENEQNSLNLAVDVLTKAGAELVPIKLNYKNNNQNNIAVLLHEFKAGLNSYLLSTDCNMKSLKDVIEYNKAHSKECLVHGQTILEKSQSKSGNLTEAEYLNALLENMEKSQGTIDNVLEENDLDLFIMANYNTIHAVSGYPAITVTTGNPSVDLVNHIIFIVE